MYLCIMIDNFINTGIVNSYKLIVGEKTMDELIEKSKIPIFLFIQKKIMIMKIWIL